MQQNKGFVWAVVLVIIALVLLFVWNKQRASAPSDSDLEVATTTPGMQQEATTSPSATTPPSATKPSTATTPKPTTPSAPTRTSSGAYIIYYNASGFSPATITLSQRSSVHFVNTGSDAMNIAPADAINQPYASFNQNKSVGKGGTYDYTFTQKGVYGYYNRNNTKHTAIIIIQ